MHHEEKTNLGERAGVTCVLLKLANEHGQEQDDSFITRTKILQARPNKMPHFKQQNKHNLL